MSMDPIKRDRRLKNTTTTLGIVSTGLLTLILVLFFFPPVATVSSVPIGHTDPPYIPPPNPCMHTESGSCPPPTPAPRDPYCLFPGQGKHLGFGNGHGRAGARFLCDVEELLMSLF